MALVYLYYNVDKRWNVWQPVAPFTNMDYL